MADIPTDPAMWGAFGAILGAFLVAFLVVLLAMYVYFALALMAIAKRTKTPNGWLAWIPIGNLYLMTQIAQVPWWTMFAFLLGIIPVVGGIAFTAVMVWWFWKIAERRGKEGWWGILMIIPIVNLVIVGMLAWGKD